MEAPKLIRICKQCGEAMAKPLEVGDKLYMFCSLHCKTVWDQARAYYSHTATKEIDDGD